MNAARHTKGPWAINTERFEDDRLQGSTHVESANEHGWANDGWIICACDGPDQGANAHLIAAAPELYEALEKMVRAAMYGSFNTVDSHPLPLARAALSKARGEHEA